MRGSLKRLQRGRRLFLGAGLVAAIVAGALAVPALAGKHGPGQLDRSFANHGTLVVRDAHDRGNSVAIGRKGRILIGGFESVTRLLPDGRLDRSFAGDGVWQSGGLGDGENFVSYGASSVAIQRKGGVVAAGASCVGGCGFAVRRLTKTGQLDRSFGNDGMAQIRFQRSDSVALSLAKAHQGKLIVGGLGCGSVARCDAELARLDRDGSLDPSFGSGGKVVTPLGRCGPNSYGMATDSHNRIVVGSVCEGHTVRQHTLELFRFKPNGGVDRSFGDHGVVRKQHVHIIDSPSFALAVDSHDRIDVAGAGKSGARVFRFDPTGKLGRSFGNDGIATAALAPWSAAIDHRGRIVIAGSGNAFAFTRLRPGGRLDRSFGHKGLVTIRNRLQYANSVAIDRRGGIVGVGYWKHDTREHPAAVRLLP